MISLLLLLLILTLLLLLLLILPDCITTPAPADTITTATTITAAATNPAEAAATNPAEAITAVAYSDLNCTCTLRWYTSWSQPLHYRTPLGPASFPQGFQLTHPMRQFIR